MDKQTYHLTTPVARQNAARAVSVAPEGMICEIKPATKKRIQEEKYHAMIGDIAKQVELIGAKRSAEDAKRLLIDAFARAMREAGTPLKQEGRILPSLDGSGFVQLGIQSRHFYAKEAAEFIEYLYAFGSEHGVLWSERFDIPEWVR
ncbi:hypothetical protein E4695_15930 [Alcaligenaceae bacterium 429]|nr:hypothetical protein E4695_15930 [Alcaligenaceae bacterium 429]